MGNLSAPNSFLENSYKEVSTERTAINGQL